MIGLRKIDTVSENVPLPGVGRVMLFFRADGKLCVQDESGVVTVVPDSALTGFLKTVTLDSDVIVAQNTTTTGRVPVIRMHVPAAQLFAGDLIEFDLVGRYALGASPVTGTSIESLRVGEGDVTLPSSPTTEELAFAQTQIANTLVAPRDALRVSGFVQVKSVVSGVASVFGSLFDYPSQGRSSHSSSQSVRSVNVGAGLTVMVCCSLSNTPHTFTFVAGFIRHVRRGL